MPSIVLKKVAKIYPIGAINALRMFGSATLRGHRGTLPISPQSKVAVDNISLSISAGETVGIIGRNGAGKSTLVHMIAGLSQPSSGSILVEGHVTSVMTLGVGIKDELTGRANIYLDGELQGRTHAEIDVVLPSIVEFADLGDFIDLPVRTYSTGMKARLGFAMITCIDPEILVIDEALSVGDVAFAAKAAKRIKELCSRGKIVILISHDTSSIVDICNRCIWLDNGRILMDGAPKHVANTYLEKVKDEDEKVLVDHFKAHTGTSSRDHRVAIEYVRTFQGNDQKPRQLLEAGVDASIQIALRLDSPLEDADLRVRIERLDGLLVYDATATAEIGAGSVLSPGRHKIVLHMLPLILGIGAYRVSVSLTASEEPVAWAGEIIEVFARAVPKGGHPALLCPCSIELQSRHGG